MKVWIKSNKKILDLIQQWGLRFENNKQHPLFNKIYVALKSRMDDFQDEDSVREKLGIPLRTPQKKRKGRPTYESSEKQDSPLDTVPVKDKPRSRPNKNKPKKKKKVHFSSSEQAKKKEFDNIVESIVLANTMIDAADPRDKDELDFIVEIVGIIKSSETTLIEAISSVQNAELLDYAIKVNDD